MRRRRNRLYVLVLSACAIGYVWLYAGMTGKKTGFAPEEVCLIKHATGVPCPSCGTTRSAVDLLNGDFLQSLYTNPFGILVIGIMFLAPLWVLWDTATGKSTFLLRYARAERWIRKPRVAVPLLVLVLANWIWNITKGL